jgi:hypothetical protein
MLEKTSAHTCKKKSTLTLGQSWLIIYALTRDTRQKTVARTAHPPTSLELSRKKANCNFNWSPLARPSACLEKRAENCRTKDPKRRKRTLVHNFRTTRIGTLRTLWMCSSASTQIVFSGFWYHVIDVHYSKVQTHAMVRYLQKSGRRPRKITIPRAPNVWPQNDFKRVDLQNLTHHAHCTLHCTNLPENQNTNARCLLLGVARGEGRLCRSALLPSCSLTRQRKEGFIKIFQTTTRQFQSEDADSLAFFRLTRDVRPLSWAFSLFRRF